jgi:hypothetical protein
MSHILDHSQSKELDDISDIINTNSTICGHILQDLNMNKSGNHRSRAHGISGTLGILRTRINHLK